MIEVVCVLCTVTLSTCGTAGLFIARHQQKPWLIRNVSVLIILIAVAITWLRHG